MKKVYAAFAVILTMTAVSCKENGFDKFWNDSNASLMVDGKNIITCDPLTWQATADENGNYAMTRDDGIEWYTVSCDEQPKDINEMVTAKIRWKTEGASRIKTLNGIALTVMKIDDEKGLITLVNKNQKVKATVHQAR